MSKQQWRGGAQLAYLTVAICFKARHVSFVYVQWVSSRMDMKSNRELCDLMVTLSAKLWTGRCCLCCQLSGVGLSSVIKALGRVYSLLFTLLASTLLSWIQFNYSTTPVTSILFGSSSPHSPGTLFLDTNIHKLLEHKIKGGVPLSSFQCSHCVCMLKPARELEPEQGEKGGGNLCTKVLVTERSP